eukprot:1160997-Pelagomonas_calceolata.AAC.2
MEAEEDLDAELERELAALGNEPGDAIWNSDHDLLQGLPPAPNPLTDSGLCVRKHSNQCIQKMFMLSKSM